MPSSVPTNHAVLPPPHAPQAEIPALKHCLQVGLLGGDASRIHCNPDCGLKTRKWEEVLPSLRNLVAAAQLVRAELGAAGGALPATPTKAGGTAEAAGAAGSIPAAPAAERRASCNAGCCARGE